jgi:hypothetical protein
MREQLYAKLAEVRELFEQATCEGKAIDIGSDDDVVGTDVGAALYTLEQMVDYYVD